MGPQRTCVGCRVVADKQSLVRFVRDSRGILAVDAEGVAPGRGAHLHPTRACLQAALRGGGFFRAMRGKIALAPQGQKQANHAKQAKQHDHETTMERLWAQLQKLGAPDQRVVTDGA